MRKINEDFDFDQATLDISSARLMSRQLSEQMLKDANEIAVLRKALIDLTKKAEGRYPDEPVVLAEIKKTAESISPANASAFETALLECMHMADVLIPILEGAKKLGSDSAFARHGSARLRVEEFAHGFAHTFQLATFATELNTKVTNNLRSSLALLSDF
jgi:hypothetical protein